MTEIDIKRLISLLGIRTAAEVFPVIVLAALIYWLIRRREHKRLFGAEFADIRRRIRPNEIIRLLLLCWLVGTVCITLTPTDFWHQLWKMLTFRSFSMPAVTFRKWRLVPLLWTHFVTYSGHYLSRFELILQIADNVENVALFIPLGLFLPVVSKKVSFPKIALASFAFTVFIEFVQPFIGRDGNIDDVICNTLGGILGFLIYLLIKALFPTFLEKCRLSAEDINE